MRLRKIAIATVMAVSAALGFASQVPVTHAIAATAHRTVIDSGHLEEAFGPALFVGTPSLDYGANVESLTGGRAMDFETTGGTFCDGTGTCYPKGVLRFTGGTNKCAQGNAQDDEVYVAHCTFDFGIIWADKVVSGHHRYINVNASGVVFHYLGSFQTDQTFLNLVIAGQPGWIEAWDWK